MKVLNQFDQLAQLNLRKGVLTIGTFDGVHVGHQKVIQRVVQAAKRKQAPSIVLTYAKHPSEVLFKDAKRHVPLITTLDQKLNLLKGLGVSYVFILPFNKRFSQMSPESFLRDKLFKSIQLSDLYLGKDTTFGKGGKGNVSLLKKMSAELGYKLTVVLNEKIKNRVVRSTRIREAIQNGEMERGAQFLGRPYSIKGKVVHGNKLGRQIGFPTANLAVENKLLPENGVYAVISQIKGKQYKGALNIGFRPTLSGKKKKLSVEVHLIGLNREIYGEECTLHIFCKLRAEKRFSNLNSLKKGILLDLDKTEKFFKKLK